MTDDLPEVRSGHPYLMYDMLKATPLGIRKTIEIMQKADYSFLGDQLVFTGNGTAYHAATLGAQILWDSNKPWKSIQAFELEHYFRPRGTLVGFSHTGKTKSTVDAIKAAGAGMVTVGVSHYPDSPLLNATTHKLLIGDSPDLSLCNTKAFFDNSFAALSIAAEFGDIDPGLENFAGKIGRAITEMEKPVSEAVSTLGDLRDIFVLGAGPSVIAAREAAQKIKEATHLHAEGIELEEFNHGCTSVIDESSLLVIVNSPEVNQRTSDIVKACREVGTRTLVLNGEGDSSVYFDAPENRYLYPVLSMVPLYYTAYFLALKMKVNPDYLRFEDRRYLDYDNIVFPPGAH